ncbi:MAG: Mini-ribonuclease 3 [Firmicutes bacterium]|nr:Mini-ribonuclease 3 [Bacillota bacterium]
MEEKQARVLNTDVLAYMGDAVYEMMIRRKLLDRGIHRSDRLHRMATGYVNAAAQAQIIRSLQPELTDKEQELIRRWRNHKYHSKARHADPMTYKWATAFEAWIGYLYLTDDQQRLEWAFERAVRIVDQKKED